MTRSKLALCLALASALSLAAPASGGWRRDGEPVQDEAWRKSDGDFGALLVVTDRLDQFLIEWEKPDDPAHPPVLRPAPFAKRGDTVWGVVLFKGCKPGAKRLCRAEVDFTVLRPDGSVYASHKNADLWHSSPPPGKNLQLSSARLGLHIEDKDPLGAYLVRAVARDLEAHRTVTVERKLEVRAREQAAPAAREK